MREIKFRGKSTKTELHTAQWRFGSFRAPSNEACKPLIYVHFSHPTHDGNGYWYEVEADTVGQFTGLKDCEGREIYEGDIVEATLKNKSFAQRFHMDETVTGKISFDGAWWLGEWNALWRLPRYYDLTVIGNVHDNPELLK